MFHALISGCGNPQYDPTEAVLFNTEPVPTETDEVTEAPTEPNTVDLTEESLSAIKDWLDKELPYGISYEYMHLGYNGVSQEIIQESAGDGSFHFVDVMRQWDYPTEFEYNEKREYYYFYEEDGFVCYWKVNDGQTDRYVYAPGEEQELFASRYLLAGSAALMPLYLEDFSKAEEKSEAGNDVYTFTLPLNKVMANTTMLSKLIQTAFDFYGGEYDSTMDVNIYCAMEVEQDSKRPVSLAYDFTELKPYVLSDGALSAEFAAGVNLMYMIYEFDYELAQTTVIPAEFLS